MPITKAKPKISKKPKINSKNKSYSLKDCGLYNISSKKLMGKRLFLSASELKPLKNDSNYLVFHISKAGGKQREIQTPYLQLDLVQTRIASLLARVELPDFVHSGVKGRSHITNAKAHIGDHPVLTMDIENYYPSISKKSVYHFFANSMICAPDVAGILAELCTYDNHVPTGSRLSMLLSFWANHCMYEDIEKYCNVRGVTTTSYVDDLTFSGKNVNRLFERHINSIIGNAGLKVHPKKTRLYRHDEPKLITGVIVSVDGVNVRNKHHKSIYNLFNDLSTAKTVTEHDLILKKLIGSLNAAGQIVSGYKNKARRLTKKSGDR